MPQLPPKSTSADTKKNVANSSRPSTSRESPPAPSVETELRFARLLSEINRKLSTGIDFRRVLDFVFESLHIIIPYDRIAIALIEGDAENPQVCARWIRSKIPAGHLDSGYCAPLKGTSLQKIIESDQPRVINDLIQYARENPQSISTHLIIQDGIRSSLTCPLRANDRAVGLVFFSSQLPHTYRDEHIHLYQAIAAELSVIVEQGRLRHAFEAAKSKSQNLRMVLHDLKSPLSLIQGFLEVTNTEPWFDDLSQDAKNIIEILQRNANYMSELLNELSMLSQLEARTDHVGIREISLAEFISEVAIDARQVADKKEISFTITTHPGLPEKVWLDPSLIRRVIDNLVTNAVKFSQRGTKIHATFRARNGRLIFEISDQGPGIPQNELASLFHEFGKTSVRPTEGESSTGLGLAIAKRIIEQHSGEISVESQVGKGSTFSFWVPLQKDRPLH
ncbi:MAG: GAF domain-containing sensor histidine kinase [Bdellovibrionaceae bacterium]|nr:GAF domain-containing sensor histidine kinase [Pseudobdellovibrionaceae bacterium]